MALSLLLTGDSILQRRLNSRDDTELRPLFDKVRAADVAFTNLEGLANDYRGDPALESGGSHFGAPAWVLDELVAAGFDLFATATANNSVRIPSNILGGCTDRYDGPEEFGEYMLYEFDYSMLERHCALRPVLYR